VRACVHGGGNKLELHAMERRRPHFWKPRIASSLVCEILLRINTYFLHAFFSLSRARRYVLENPWVSHSVYSNRFAHWAPVKELIKMAWLLGVNLRCIQLQGFERKSNCMAALSSNHLSPCPSNALFCWKAEVFSDCGPLVFTNRGLWRLYSKRSKRVRQDSWVWQKELWQLGQDVSLQWEVRWGAHGHG